MVLGPQVRRAAGRDRNYLRIADFLFRPETAAQGGVALYDPREVMVRPTGRCKPKP